MPCLLTGTAQFQGHADPVADAGDRLDHRAILISKCETQLGDGCRQRALDDFHTGPDGLEQFILGGDLPGAAEQLVQQGQGLGFDQALPAPYAQLPAAFIELGFAQTPDPRWGSGIEGWWIEIHDKQ